MKPNHKLLENNTQLTAASVGEETGEEDEYFDIKSKNKPLKVTTYESMSNTVNKDVKADDEDDLFGKIFDAEVRKFPEVIKLTNPSPVYPNQPITLPS